MTAPVPRRTALRSAAALAVGSVALAGTGAACAPAGDRSRPSPPSGSSRSHLAPDGAHTVVPAAVPRAGVVEAGDSLHDQSLAASRALLDRASAVVVAPTPDDVGAGTATARRLGLPLLVAGPGLSAELDRLGVRTVVREAAPGGPGDSLAGDRQVVTSADTDALERLPGLPLRPTAHAGAGVLAPDAPLPPGVEATLDAVGADRIQLQHSDPRLAPEAFGALRAGAGPVLGVGAALGPAERLAQRVRTVRHAEELPGGGYLPFPGRRMVALYGHPGTASLGMLGEQSASDAVVRATTLATEYAALTDTPVVPAFELIATVAARSAGADGSYSRRTPVERLLPWVEAAEGAGAYAVLDLQPGRTDFLEQAQHYEELLRRPWVGLALDPEWRLWGDQVHLEQIGSVGVDEVNRVGRWLAGLVREHDLPPKVLTLHQFRPSMVRDRARLDTSLDEIQWLVHADGLGSQDDKQATWRALRRDLPPGVWLGWKNFEDEDTPMLTPRQTMARVSPTPWFVSYQ
ncbi:MAG TPA: hypothetical protein VFI44_07930 [Ornithinibacter sp.]|nr:hypothetical protein [Ornithinibacter sp.]